MCDNLFQFFALDLYDSEESHNIMHAFKSHWGKIFAHVVLSFFIHITFLDKKTTRTTGNILPHCHRTDARNSSVSYESKKSKMNLHNISFSFFQRFHTFSSGIVIFCPFHLNVNFGIFKGLM